MFNFLTFWYADAASRNPRPFLVFALVFFCLLLGPLFLKVLLSPDPYARFKTSEYKAELEASARRDMQARAQVHDYCKEKNLAPWQYVTTTVDSKQFDMMCTMGMPSKN